jgi:hypothetical protein
MHMGLTLDSVLVDGEGLLRVTGFNNARIAKRMEVLHNKIESQLEYQCPEMHLKTGYTLIEVD